MWRFSVTVLPEPETPLKNEQLKKLSFAFPNVKILEKTKPIMSAIAKMITPIFFIYPSKGLNSCKVKTIIAAKKFG
jgi:hypothetical protein